MHKNKKMINNKKKYLMKKERKDMLKLKRIIVLLVIVFLVWGYSIQVNASNPTLDLGNMLNSNTTTNEATNETTTNETTTNETTNEDNSGIVQPDTNKESEADKDLPQTGVTEDITVMFFIIVCAIVAIYAYKKIRDYKA